MIHKLSVWIAVLTLILGANTMSEAKKWDKTFPQSNKVEVKKYILKTATELNLPAIYIHPKINRRIKWRLSPFPARSAR